MMTTTQTQTDFALIPFHNTTSNTSNITTDTNTNTTTQGDEEETISIVTHELGALRGEMMFLETKAALLREEVQSKTEVSRSLRLEMERMQREIEESKSTLVVLASKAMVQEIDVVTTTPVKSVAMMCTTGTSMATEMVEMTNAVEAAAEFVLSSSSSDEEDKEEEETKTRTTSTTTALFTPAKRIPTMRTTGTMTPPPLPPQPQVVLHSSSLSSSTSATTGTSPDSVHAQKETASMGTMTPKREIPTMSTTVR